MLTASRRNEAVEVVPTRMRAPVSTSANYYGDYYPLTPYSRANDVWIAWQFHRSELDTGMVQAFREGTVRSQPYG